MRTEGILFRGNGKSGKFFCFFLLPADDELGMEGWSSETAFRRSLSFKGIESGAHTPGEKLNEQPTDK